MPGFFLIPALLAFLEPTPLRAQLDSWQPNAPAVQVPPLQQARRDTAVAARALHAILQRAEVPVDAAPSAVTSSPAPLRPLWIEATADSFVLAVQRPLAEALQADPAFGIGALLNVVDLATGQAREVRVLARALIGPGADRSCGGFASTGEWFYLLDAAAPELRMLNPDSEGSGAGAIAMPTGVTAVQPRAAWGYAAARAGLEEAMRPDLDAAYARLRAELTGYQEVQPGTAPDPRMVYETNLEYFSVLALRGPGGRTYYWFSGRLNDDASYHELGTAVTYITDAAGKIIQRESGQHAPVLLLDLDADGVDEVLTENGVALFRDGRWLLPPADRPADFC